MGSLPGVLGASEETHSHLFWDCAFARQVWHAVAPLLCFSKVDSPTVPSLGQWWDQLIGAKVVRRAEDGIIITTCWNIWKERNARIFRHEDCWPDDVVLKIKNDLALV